MNIATAITEVITFDATVDELKDRELIIERARKQQPVSFGSDVIGDFGIKIHFIDEPKFFELGDTVVKCVVRVKITVDKELAQMLNVPTETNRCFTGFAKCRPMDADKYDFDFAKKITMNKAKVNAYLYFQKMFVLKAQKMHKNLVKTIGFCKKMEGLIDGNTKYIFDTCNAMYPEPETETPVGEVPNGPAENPMPENK